MSTLDFLKFKQGYPHKYQSVKGASLSQLTIFSIDMLNFQQKMDPQNLPMGKVAKLPKAEKKYGWVPFCALLKHGRKLGFLYGILEILKNFQPVTNLQDASSWQALMSTPLVAHYTRKVVVAKVGF